MPARKNHTSRADCGTAGNHGIAGNRRTNRRIPADPGKTSMVSHKMLDDELNKWIYDYYMCKPVDYVLVENGGGTFTIDLTQLPKGTHELTVCAFDRFLNKTEGRLAMGDR